MIEGYYRFDLPFRRSLGDNKWRDRENDRWVNTDHVVNELVRQVQELEEYLKRENKEQCSRCGAWYSKANTGRLDAMLHLEAPLCLACVEAHLNEQSPDDMAEVYWGYCQEVAVWAYQHHAYNSASTFHDYYTLWIQYLEDVPRILNYLRESEFASNSVHLREKVSAIIFRLCRDVDCDITIKDLYPQAQKPDVLEKAIKPMIPRKRKVEVIKDASEVRSSK